MTDVLKNLPVDACRFQSQAIQFMDDADEETPKRYLMTVFDGQIIDHWWFGKFTFEASGIKFRKPVIPAFRDHDHSRLTGLNDTLSIVDSKVTVEGAFLKNSHAEEVRILKAAGIECSLAFLYDTAKFERVDHGFTATVNGKDFVGPGVIVRECELYECSFTLIGAMTGASTEFSQPVHFQNNFSQEENNMDSQNPMANEGAQIPSNEDSRTLFSKMNELCSDAKFVNECFSEGLDMAQFQAKNTKRLDDKVVELSALNVEKDAKISELEGKIAEFSKLGQAPLDNLEQGEEAQIKTADEAVKFIKARDHVSMIEANRKARSEFSHLFNGGK